MSLKTTFAAALSAACFALPALADGIMVHDAYARSSGKSAKSGAAFMVLMNQGDSDDRLISAQSDIAKRVELHTHKENADGVMQMIHVEDGFVIPAGGQHELARGGDHVMFMGLTAPLEQGDTISVTLTFEKAGPITVEIPVDLARKPKHGKMHGHKSGG